MESLPGGEGAGEMEEEEALFGVGGGEKKAEGGGIGFERSNLGDEVAEGVAAAVGAGDAELERGEVDGEEQE